MLWPRLVCNMLILVIFCFFLSACTNTKGLHTSQEKHRLAMLHAELALEFLVNQNLDVAEGEAQEALYQEPDGVESNFAMARVQLELGDFTQAEKYFKRALKPNAYNPVVVNEYAQFLCNQGQLKLAMQQFDRAGKVLMSSQRMLSYTRAATCLARNGEPDQAVNYLDKALELNPISQALLLNAARLSHKAQAFQQALDYLDRYFKVNVSPTQDILRLKDKINADIASISR